MVKQSNSQTVEWSNGRKNREYSDLTICKNVKRSNGRMVEWSKNIEYSDLTNCKNVEWSNSQTVEKYRILSSYELRFVILDFGLLDFWTFGLLDFWTFGLWTLDF